MSRLDLLRWITCTLSMSLLEIEAQTTDTAQASGQNSPGPGYSLLISNVRDKTFEMFDDAMLTQFNQIGPKSL